MTRSKVRKLKRAGAVLASGTFAAALFGQMPLAYAQSAAQPVTDSEGLEEIIVTAEKRTQNLQDVRQHPGDRHPRAPPSCISKIYTIHEDDPDRFEFQESQAGQQSLSCAVRAGDYPNHSASLPSVGAYLDDQPLTTILGAIDVHVYDIERVEALARSPGALRRQLRVRHDPHHHQQARPEQASRGLRCAGEPRPAQRRRRHRRWLRR